MGLLSFSGRVLFSAIFILAAWQKMNDFGNDGGSAVRSLQPKAILLKQHIGSTIGCNLPDFELKYFLMAAIALEGFGGIMFIFGSTFGAYLLLVFLATVTPLMHDFYNYNMNSAEYSKELIQFLKNLSMVGALLFFIGMKNSYAKRPKKKASKVKST